MTSEGKLCRIGFSIFLIVLIIVGNGLVMTSYRFNSRVRSLAYVLIISLAVSDALIGVVTLPLWIYVGTVRQWKSSQALQEFYLTWDIFTALASTMHLTVICIERFIAITKPYMYNTLRPRMYTLAISAIWGISLLLATLYPVAKFLPKDEKSALYLTRIYTLSFIFVFFIFPMIVITVINIIIFFIVKRLTRFQPARPSGRNGIQSRRTLRKEYKTALTLVVVTGLFYAAWLPFFVVTLLSTYCWSSCLPSSVEKILLLMELIKWLQYSQSAFNPFIYAFRDREMRLAFYRLFLWCKGNHSRVLPWTSSNPNSNLNPTPNSSSVHPMQTPTNPVHQDGLAVLMVTSGRALGIQTCNDTQNKDIDLEIGGRADNLTGSRVPSISVVQTPGHENVTDTDKDCTATAKR